MYKQKKKTWKMINRKKEAKKQIKIQGVIKKLLFSGSFYVFCIVTCTRLGFPDSHYSCVDMLKIAVFRLGVDRSETQ